VVLKEIAQNEENCKMSSDADNKPSNSFPQNVISPSQKLSRAVSERVNNEINRLVSDITRIAPEGEPWCKFGPLFDDPEVEQYYEALVGTLKSAKKRGIIKFQGQMLLKGMHDNVKIEII